MLRNLLHPPLHQMYHSYSACSPFLRSTLLLRRRLQNHRDPHCAAGRSLASASRSSAVYMPRKYSAIAADFRGRGQFTLILAKPGLPVEVPPMLRVLMGCGFPPEADQELPATLPAALVATDGVRTRE